VNNEVLYVPTLYWRMAEYQALFRLSEKAKLRICPLITIPDIEFDFEEKRPKKTLEQHLEKLPARFVAKWGKRSAWVDAHQAILGKRLTDQRLPLEFFFDELRGRGAQAVPVISLDADRELKAAIRKIVRVDQRGVGLRIRLLDLMSGQVSSRVRELQAHLRCDPKECDLLVDLGAPNYQPIDVFADQLVALLPSADLIRQHRRYVLTSCAYPQRLKLQKPGGTVPRSDWDLYVRLSQLLRRKRLPTPHYGDYTVVHPELTLLDPRMMKPSGKIVYATPTEWLVAKGSAFRSDPAQMHDHARTIVNSGSFRGRRFSEGDEFIALCARNEVGPSSLTRWKEVGISHHVMQVLESLATTAAAA
jgi:hypothetical protein